MKRSIQKIKNAHQKLSRKIRVRDRSTKIHTSMQASVTKWVDRSKDMVSDLPTLTELREEFADWHSFEPMHLDELNPA